MDKIPVIELSNLNQNKPNFIRSDSSSSDAVPLRKKRNSDNESGENSNGKSDGVTFRTSQGIDNPTFIAEEGLNQDNQKGINDKIEVEPEEFDSLFNRSVISII